MEMHATRRLLRWWPLLLLFFTSRSAGQDVLRKRVTLPAAQISADHLRKEISRQTGLQFSFGSSTIRPQQSIRLPQRTCTASELLDIMKTQLKADYKLYGDHVIFTKGKAVGATANTSSSGKHHPQRTSRPSSANTSGSAPGDNTATVHAPSPNKTNGSSTAKPSSKAAKRAPLVASGAPANSTPAADTGQATATAGTVTDSAGRNPGAPGLRKPGDVIGSTFPSAAMAKQEALPSLQADERLRQRAYRSLQMPTDVPQRIKERAQTSPAIPAGKTSNRNSKDIFTRYTTVGIALSEYLPVSAVFKGGIPFLHGIIGYSSNFSQGSLRYGGGTRYSFDEKWHAQAEFTTGRISRSFQTDSAGFASKSIRITEKLHRISLQAERTIGKRWSLVAGISWNMLHRVNTDKGNRLAPGDRVFNDPVPAEGYRAVKPLYTLSSSFDEGQKAWKDNWPGVQLGAYLRF